VGLVADKFPVRSPLSPDPPRRILSGLRACGAQTTRLWVAGSRPEVPMSHDTFGSRCGLPG